MATIGSISVAFTGESSSLDSAISAVTRSLESVGEAVDALREKLSGLSSLTVSVAVDRSGIDEATRDIESLKSKAASSPANLTVSADSSQVEDLSTAMDDLGDATATAGGRASGARSSLASLVVTTAQVAVAAQQVVARYRDFRDAFLASIESVTGVRDASAALGLAFQGLAGNADALRAIFGGLRAGIEGMVAGFLSAENVNNLLQASLGGVLRLFGMQDDAVRASVQVLADFVTQQVSAAASSALVSRSLGALNTAYDNAADALARFLTQTTAGRAAASAISQGLSVAVRAASALDTAIESTVSTVGGFLTSGRLLDAVASSTAAAFDAVAAAVAPLGSGIASLGSGAGSLASRLGPLVAGFTSLVPSSAAVSAGLASIASGLGRIISVIGPVTSAIDAVVGGLSVKTSGGFAALLARMAATSASFGVARGALLAYAGGTSILGGAMSGAVAGLTTFSATLPLIAPLAIAAALATGNFSKELEKLANEAEQIDQMATRFGAPREEIEKLRAAAAASGVGLSQLAKGQQNFYTSLSKIKVGQLNTENVREAKLAFDVLGISLKEVQGSRPDEVFKRVAAELSKVEDPAKRTQLAFDLFGKQGAMILPALKEFGELAEDFDRLGGSIKEIDFQRFMDLDKALDRSAAASDSLSRALLIPFTELQASFKNISADISGGLAGALAPVMSVLADMTKPFAAIIEIVGRMISVFLRAAEVATTLIAGMSRAMGIADIFTGIRDAVFESLEPVEEFLSAVQALADSATNRLSPFRDFFIALGENIGFVVGALAQLTTYVAIGAAAWAIYSAAVAMVTGFSITATVNFIAMWAAALGPITLIVAGLALIGLGITFLIKKLTSLIGWFTAFKGARSNINAATASVGELAKAAQDAGTATGRIDGGTSLDEMTKSISEAREGLGDLTIRAARFGTAGADAAKVAQQEFNALQQKLAKGSIDIPTFEEESKKIRENLKENLDILANDSPEITLQKNLELYKQLDDAAKQAAKSVRDIGADVQIGDKIFPRSEEVKARAKQFQEEYVAALEEIKKKQQAGGFADDLAAKKKQNEDDFASGKITKDQFEKTRLQLDSTTAQEQASIAAEDVQREFQRKKVKLEADLSFADSIRKELETAFLSPVEKFQKELKKIRDNPELTAEEKASAEKNLRKNAREGLIGKTATEQFDERKTDIAQAREAGLINESEAAIEAAKAADELAKALGIPVDPANALQAATLQLQEAFKNGKISAEDLAKGLAESRRAFLETLGIKERPEEADKRRLEELDKRRGKPASEGGISEEEYQRGRKAIENDIIGQSAADRIGEQRSRIEAGMASGAIDKGRGDAALRGLAIEKKQAAGMEITPAEQLQSGVDKINDVFGTAGLTIQQIQAKLSPAEFAKYQEAVKKNREEVLKGLGVEKAGVVALAELGEKLKSAGATAAETAQAMRKANDSFMSSLGVSKTPMEEFEGRIANIAEQFDMAGKPLEEVRESLKGNAEKLALFDRAVKAARDNLLQSLGIEKTPQQVFEEQMKKISEAESKGSANGGLTKEEASQARTNVIRARDEALGAVGASGNFASKFIEEKKKIDEAFGASGQKDPEKFRLAMEKLKQSLPGSEDVSPVQKFKDEMSQLEAIRGQIGEAEFGQRRSVLQAQLQENLKPALDSLKPDRRSIESSDVRSKAGVDTFFRILRGQDNPSLKAQLEIARNTRLLAEASREPDAAPLIAALPAGR